VDAVSLGLTRLERALAKGAVIRLCEGIWKVYRGDDARRRAVGELQDGDIDKLRAAGRVVSYGAGWRGVERDWADPVLAVRPRPIPRAAPRGRGAPHLAIALQLCDDEVASRRLAAAAMRFLEDVAASERGQVVSMNWDLTPSGRRRGAGRGPSGQGAEALQARRSLIALEQALPAAHWQLLQRALVQGMSLGHLAVSLSIAPREMAEAVNGALVQLADAYDQVVPARD